MDVRDVPAGRDVRFFVLGQILSTAGDTALWIALGIWIKTLTGSAAAAGLAFFMVTLGSLGGPFGGMLADRVRRRLLLIVVNLATAALVLLLLLVDSKERVWLIYVVLAGYGLSGAVTNSAQTALLRAMVPIRQLGGVNSVLQTAQQGLRLVTPLIGAGRLAAFGAGPVIIGDAVTFVIAAGALMALRFREEKPGPRRGRWLAEVSAGGRHILRTIPLCQLAVAAMLALTAFGLSETVVFAVVDDGLGRPDTFLGFLISAQGVGAIAAGVVATRLMRRVGEGVLVGLGVGAALVAVLDYRVVLLVIVALTAVGAGYLLTRREQRRRPGVEVDLPVGTCRDR